MISKNNNHNSKMLWWCSIVCILAAVNGFSIHQKQQQAQFFLSSSSSRVSSSSTALFGRKKRGLGTLAADGMTDAPSSKRTTTTLKQRSTRKGKKSASTSSNKKKDEKAAISPALAEWMASQKSSSDTAVAMENVDEGDDREEETVAFQTFDDNNSNNRRVKQSQRKDIEDKRAEMIEMRLDALDSALEESGNLEGILSAVQGLLDLPSDSLRLLLAGKRRFDYRLAWVGSDDAICHVGTGLHKVPLARLQEVFMSCLGRSRLELLEVIRILGPFPNVKNTLQGTTKIDKKGSNNDVGITSLNLVIDSMIDGTGKEILAGKEENVRRVDLQVYFADERAIVAVVPPEDGSYRKNPLEDKGKNVLVFVKEEDLESKLDSLRVL